MEQCESLDAEMTELQDFRCQASDAISQDDEDEVQELQNSLREAVQDKSVKPKLQCLMVDPSFSMVTVQSEDSGIVWETASSRCSTPWASETSSISEACSMEGSGTAGKITIVFDEDKIVRRRTRSGGRSSRIGDRLSRHGSSRSASALGVERPEMAEVSLPNVKQETTETEPDLEEIKSKDQQLFSLISEGYEILNIRVPSKLPTVDEEESTELQDNLSYLEQTPMIRSRKHVSWTTQDQATADETEILDCDQPSKPNSTEPSVDTEFKQTQTHKDGDPSDIDYFEKFTLVDEVVPGEQAPELQPQAMEQLAAEPHPRQTAAEVATVNPAELEDSFVFVSDVELVGEHLDEVFYGDGAPAMQRREDDGEEDERGTRARRESQRSVKESGSVLFGSEETTLKPIFISPGPPKIIDPILLEEPTAMSFMYSDLYENSVGERRKSDEEYSEAESMTSEKSFQRCLSESEEADGYLEKFTLKDELPAVEVQAEPAEEKRQGRMMWSQTKFEMTGCLTRVVEEEDKDTIMEEVVTAVMNETAISDDKQDVAAETENDKEGGQLSTVADGQVVSHESIQPSEVTEKGTQDWEVKQVEPEPPEGISDVPLPETRQLDNETEKTEEHQREEPEGKVSEPSVIESQTHEVKTAAVPGETSTEIPQTAIQSETQTETTGSNLSGETAANIDTLATDHKKIYARTEFERVKECETVSKDMLHSSQSLSEMETSVLKEEDIVPEQPAAVEVSTECEMAVHAVVRVTETKLDEKENQTDVQIDLREVTPSDAETQPEGKERPDVLPEETEVNVLNSGPIINQELKAKSKNINKNLLMQNKRMTYGKKESEIIQSTTIDEMYKSNTEARTKTPLKDSGTAAQESADVEGEVIVLVPKGRAVEMDINIGQWSEEMTECVTVALPEHPVTSDDDTTSKTLQAPVEETREREGKQEEAEIIVINQQPSSSTNSDKRTSSGLREAETEEDFKGDEGISSPLRSFPPQEDLSGLHWEERDAAGVEQVDIQGGLDAVRPETDLHKDDVVQGQEQREAVEEDAETTIESDYEMISKQDVRDIPEPGLLRDAAEQRPEAGRDRDEGLELVVKTEEKDSCLFADEELIEADYEIIDAEEESQARLVAELQGMDWFCGTCERLLSQHDFVSGEHRGHEVTAVDEAFEEIKEKLSDWISVLQERSENIEDLVSELELAYNSVEDQFVESEAALQAQNEEMMALVMEQYNSMSVSMEEEKKAKLEQLYDQIVSFQENIDAAKAILETTVREAETDARSPEDINARLVAALESTMSLELGSKGLLVFEDYAKGNASSSHLTQRKGIPVPQKPSLQPQEQGTATSTNVTVYWKVNDGDVIDCFQVYCMEDPQGAVSEEYRVTVKESYCVLEELEPDKTYRVWVMAVNYTGCSLPSERLAFRTAPSVPVIDTERCTVTWDSAMLRWSPGKLTPEQSYTLEYCRQYELEGEGLRSISGIKSCVHTVLLQPNENYLFYIKTVNEAGASDQSEAALISTKGTRFHLLKATAHPALELSADQTTVHYTQDAHKHIAPSGKRCPSVLGELLPARGYYYWETIVSGCAAYRLGVVYGTANKSSSLGENRISWCLQCIPTPSGCRYQLLHSDIQSSVFVIDSPERVGTLLDYQLGRLCFYNAVSGQLLGVFRQHFSQLCHPALALEMPGSLQVCMIPEVPEFTKES